MLRGQGGVCAICKRTETNPRYDHLGVDHDHNTGQVRGLLCSMCNQALGMLSDSPEILEEAVAYLRRF